MLVRYFDTPGIKNCLRISTGRPEHTDRLIAALLSVASVPLVVGWMISSGRTAYQPSPAQFFFAIAFPYLLIAALAAH